MTLKKILFVDDRTSRIQKAREKYGADYDLTIATNVKETLRALAYQEFHIVSLDGDLNGDDFDDPKSKNSGMEVIRYLDMTGWPEEKTKPEFWVHSTNVFIANKMVSVLQSLGYSAVHAPFGWKKYQRGVVAGAFDLIHPGYILLLEEAKRLCHHVTVLLHDKPDRVLSVEAREMILRALRFVDDVIVYKTEEDLTKLLLELSPDVRIVGSDHQDKSTRPDLPFPTVYHTRQHDWSDSRLKRMVAEKYIAENYKRKVGS